MFVHKNHRDRLLRMTLGNDQKVVRELIENLVLVWYKLKPEHVLSEA